MKFLAGIVVGVLLGSAVGALASGEMSPATYNALSHEAKVLYIQGIAEGLAASQFMTGIATLGGADPAA